MDTKFVSKLLRKHISLQHGEKMKPYNHVCARQDRTVRLHTYSSHAAPDIGGPKNILCLCSIITNKNKTLCSFEIQPQQRCSTLLILNRPRNAWRAFGIVQTKKGTPFQLPDVNHRQLVYQAKGRRRRVCLRVL